MEAKVEKMPKNTVKLTVSIPSKKVSQVRNEIIAKAVDNAEIPGFRKGKAPREKVLQRLKDEEINGETVNELLKSYYPQALKEHHLSPISNPKVDIKKFDENQDFEFEATFAIKPDVKIKDYKTSLKNLFIQKKDESKKLNEEKLKKGEKLDDSHIHISPGEIIKTLVDNTDVEVSDLLIEDEVTRMMARLIDQINSLNMTVEQYLSAQNRTAEQLKTEYSQIANNTLKAEFALSKLIEEKDVKVDDKEVDEMIEGLGDEKVKKQFQDKMQRWYIKSIIAKNKVISELEKEAKS